MRAGAPTKRGWLAARQSNNYLFYGYFTYDGGLGAHNFAKNCWKEERGEGGLSSRRHFKTRKPQNFFSRRGPLFYHFFKNSLVATGKMHAEHGSPGNKRCQVSCLLAATTSYKTEVGGEGLSRSPALNRPPRGHYFGRHMQCQTCRKKDATRPRKKPQFG